MAEHAPVRSAHPARRHHPPACGDPAARRPRARRRRRARRGVAARLPGRPRGRVRLGPARVRRVRRHVGGLDRRRGARGRSAPGGRGAAPSDAWERGARAQTGRESGRRPRAASRCASARRAGRAAGAAAAPLAPAVAAGLEPGGAALRAARAPPRAARDARDPAAARGARADRTARSTGACASPPSTVRSGRRVVFGAPGAPEAGVTEAVLASCAVPWMFRPVTIGGREYVDGGVWSAANLDAAPVERGDEVLCLNPTASPRLAVDRLGAMRAFAGAGAAAEALVLRRRGARVADRRARRRHGRRDRARTCSTRRRRPPVEAAGYAQGRALSRIACRDETCPTTRARTRPPGRSRPPTTSSPRERHWADARDPSWGIFRRAGGRGRRAAGRRRDGRRRARLRHRVLLRLAGAPRRPADRRRRHREPARDRARDAGASTGSSSRSSTRAPRTCRCPTAAPTSCSASTARRCGASRRPGSPRPPGCCARGGQLVFLTNSRARRAHRAADAARTATGWSAPSAAISPLRFEDDDGVEFHLSHGDWIALLARHGFAVTGLHELYAPEGAEPTRYDWMTVEWARRWPVEEIWTARLSAAAPALGQQVLSRAGVRRRPRTRPHAGAHRPREDSAHSRRIRHRAAAVAPRGRARCSPAPGTPRPRSPARDDQVAALRSRDRAGSRALPAAALGGRRAARRVPRPAERPAAPAPSRSRSRIWSARPAAIPWRCAAPRAPAERRAVRGTPHRTSADCPPQLTASA